MFGIEVVLILMLIRVLLPLGLMLWLGEWVRRREIHYWFR
jgi:hypothetical protein